MMLRSHDVTRSSILATLAAACCALGVLAPAADVEAATKRSSAKLTRFDSCPQLLRYAKAHRRQLGGQRGDFGLVAPTIVPARGLRVEDVTPVAAAPAAPDGVGGPGAGSGTDFSTTNVQEQGVDEPDMIKVAPNRVVLLADEKLRVIDISGTEPRVLGSLAIEGGRELLLSGQRAIVLGSRWTSVPLPEAAPTDKVSVPRVSRDETVLTEVDLSDPAALKVARTMTVPGSYVTARQTGTSARIVVNSRPLASTVLPERLPLRRIVPATTIRSKLSGRTYRRGVVPCGSIRRPAAYAGLDLTTVLTVDLGSGLQNVDRDAVMANTDTVYGSPTSLYVVNHRYMSGIADSGDLPDDARTEIHRFDTASPTQTTYTGSGSVEGMILNQFSLSERGGVLRVASTNEPTWLPDGTRRGESESFVTTFKADAGPLTALGKVGGLGKGERIYAVRFLDDVGYVVTFRQVDPLYTIDLANPAAPRVAGELKIPGYSSYLHPIGDGRLIGIGQDADDNGRVKGTQIALFDVGNPAAPKQLSKLTYPDSWSDAENDHHAFLWWAPTKLLVVPNNSEAFTGARGIRVEGDVLREQASISQPQIGAGESAYAPPITRSFVHGDALYTYAPMGGLQSSALDTLATRAYLQLAERREQGAPMPLPGRPGLR